MKHYYPAASLSWASDAAQLTEAEVIYGLHEGFLEIEPTNNHIVRAADRLSTWSKEELASVRDVLFRVLLLNLYRQWFLCDRPLRSLEFLVLDFEDCPTAAVSKGKLLSGIAGISEEGQPSELNLEYFVRKVRTFQFLTEHVVEIVREGLRKIEVRE